MVQNEKLAFRYPVSQFSSDCHRILQPLLSVFLATTLKISALVSEILATTLKKLDHLTCNAILRINRNGS